MSDPVTDGIVADTLAIAAVPAPTGGEDARAAWLEERLRDAAGRLHRDEVGNLHWRVGEPPFDVMLLVHLDTVFDDTVDHRPAERDGWLHGPGIGDNSVAVATAVHVVERLGAEADGLAVVFTVGEEGLGSLRGARHACATVEARSVLALEGHGLDSVFVDAVGCLRARVTVQGPGGHSWWDRGRPSATHELVRLLAWLLSESPDSLALNVGRLHGGTAVNAIAVEAHAVLEGRSLDEAALDHFAQALDDLGRNVTVDVLDRRPSGHLDRSDPLLAAVLAERQALGLAPGLADGSTDANAALAAALPALALGCTRGADMHSPQERIEVAPIRLGAAQLEGVLLRLLRTDRAQSSTTDVKEAS